MCLSRSSPKLSQETCTQLGTSTITFGPQLEPLGQSALSLVAWVNEPSLGPDPIISFFNGSSPNNLAVAWMTWRSWAHFFHPYSYQINSFPLFIRLKTQDFYLGRENVELHQPIYIYLCKKLGRLIITTAHLSLFSYRKQEFYRIPVANLQGRCMPALLLITAPT